MTDDLPPDLPEETALVNTVIIRESQSKTVKIACALAAAFASLAFLILAIYSLPTSKANSETARSNAEAVRVLAIRTAQQKQEDDCYQQFSTTVGDAHAEVLAALAASEGNDKALLVALAAQPRDPQRIRELIANGDVAGHRNIEASIDYARKLKARDDWQDRGRPLPCPKQPD